MQDAGWSADIERWESDSADSDDSIDEEDADDARTSDVLMLMV